MVKAYYDRIYASSYLDLDEQGNTFAKIADLWRETKPKMRILDIGCGAGSVSGELVQRGHLVYGLDVMEEAIRRATQRGLIARVYDVNQRLPLKDGYFDCVLALDILEHLFDPLAALQEKVLFCTNTFGTIQILSLGTIATSVSSLYVRLRTS